MENKIKVEKSEEPMFSLENFITQVKIVRDKQRECAHSHNVLLHKECEVMEEILDTMVEDIFKNGVKILCTSRISTILL